jgi:predicted O-linked N-acetylglucosamine transferase (SPINDLY family)
MNIARKTRREAQRHAGKSLPTDPPDSALAPLRAASTNPSAALAIAQGLMARWPQSALLQGCAGGLCLQLGDAAAALPLLESAAALAPDNAIHANTCGIALARLGRPAQAEAAFQRAFRLNPAYAEAHYNLGNLYLDHGQNPPAIVQYLRAVEIQPDHAQALNNLGMALLATNNPREAANAFACAAKAQPGYQQALVNHAQTLAQLGQAQAALDRYDAALRLGPHYTADRLACFQAALISDWSAHARFARLPVLAPAGEAATAPFSALPFEDAPERHLARSRAYAAQKMLPAQPRPNPAPAPRLRIGYFSCDFHDHATMYLLAGLLRDHDTARFAIHGLNYGPPRDDTMARHARAHIEHFHELHGMDDAQAIAHIRALDLDIIVDLKGFTQGTRSPLLGAGLAPVQAAWLGYPGSLGHPAYDYAIADATVLPAAMHHTFDEKIVWLPNSYQPNDNQRPIAPDRQTRADHGLPDDAFVFCSFNAPYKTGPAEFAIWMRLLADCPKAVLWLLAPMEATRANLRIEAAKRGIDPFRLIFADDVDHHQHLGRMAHADLFLDSFAVNAHTTCSDALWAGLPVLTMAGQGFAARVGASLLNAANMPELVTTTSQDYETRARALAQDPTAHAALRAKLAAERNTCALFDTPAFARAIEAAFATMIARHRQGLPPAHIDLRS